LCPITIWPSRRCVGRCSLFFSLFVSPLVLRLLASAGRALFLLHHLHFFLFPRWLGTLRLFSGVLPRPAVAVQSATMDWPALPSDARLPLGHSGFAFEQNESASAFFQLAHASYSLSTGNGLHITPALLMWQVAWTPPGAHGLLCGARVCLVCWVLRDTCGRCYRLHACGWVDSI